MNPFHVWLGLPESSANPNHYQLLGIKSSERDAKVIEQAARIRLSQLKKVTPEQGQTDSLEKLTRRVRKAHRILSDSATRAEYDKKLAAKLESVRKQKRMAPLAMDAATPSTEVDDKPDPSAKAASTSTSPENAQPPPVQLPIPEPPMAPRTANPAGSSVPPATPPVIAMPVTDPNSRLAQTDIPMAVPIWAQDSMASESLPQASVSPEGFSLNNEARDSVEVSVKGAKYRRKKRSYLVPIIGLILCVIGIVALTYVVINMDDLKSLSAKSETSDKQTATDLSGTSVLDQPVEKDAAKTINSDRPDTDKPPKEAGEWPANTNPAESKSVGTESNVNIVSLSFDELVRVRRHLENAHRSMYRRDAQTAQNEIDNARSMFVRFETNAKIALDPTQNKIRDRAEAAAKIKSLLEGFWEQVVGSTVKIAAGQPIRVADYELGFVEGTEDFVVLRVDGSNVTYQYPFLPVGIAMALAEQGEKKDIPTWRMQKAAFYAVHTHLDSKYRARAIESCNEASLDNHDPSPIVNYLDFDLISIGVPETKSESLDPAEIKELTPKALVRLGLNDFKSIRPDQAERAIETVLDAAMVEKDSKLRAIDFEMAYKLAIKSGNARHIADVLDEYGLWVNIDRGLKLSQALLPVSQAQLDDRRARFLLDEIVDSVTSISDQRLKQKLINNGKKVGQQFGLDDHLRRLDRL